MPTLRPFGHRRPCRLVLPLLLAVAALGIAAPALSAPASAQAPAGEPLHLLVGRSVLINSPSRFTRVLVSDPAIMQALVTTPNQVVLEAKAAGSGSLLLWDATGRSRLLDVSVDVDVAGLRQAIRAAYPAAPVTASADGGRIVLTGAVADSQIADGIVKLAGDYSPAVVDSLRLDPPPDPPVRQIMLAVRFAEVDRTKVNQFAFNLLSTGKTLASTSTQQLGPATVGGGAPSSSSTSSTTSTSGSSGTSGSTSTGLGFNNLLNIFLFNSGVNLGATIADLEQKEVLQILAAPNLMAISGQKASFLAGGEFPVPVVQGGANVGAVTIQFRPYGVELDFTGTINPDNTIRLQVAPEVSTLDYTNAVTISGFSIPALSTRKADTVVELKDGQSFGIAGLLDQQASIQLSRMPGIANIPILGQLFRSHNNQLSNSELLVLVTPHIVDTARPAAPVPASPPLAVPYLDDHSFDRGVSPAKSAPGGGQ